MKKEKGEVVKSFVKKNDWGSPLISNGWGNGYVIVSKNHPLWGKDYNDRVKVTEEPVFNENYLGLLAEAMTPEEERKEGTYPLSLCINVHGGITFARPVDGLDWPEIPKGCEGYWIFGFDTSHAGDDPETWPKERVMEETENFKQQIQKFVVWR